MTKKVLLTLFVILFSLNVRAADTASITPKEVHAATGESFDVQIMEQNPAAKAIQLKVMYDPALLTATTVTTGISTNSNTPWKMVYNTNVPGIIQIGLYSERSLSLGRASQHVATIGFKAKKPISSTKSEALLSILGGSWEESRQGKAKK